MPTVKQHAVAARRKAPAKPRTLHLTNPLMEGADVAELQKLLKPFHPGKVDGQYGPATAALLPRRVLQVVLSLASGRERGRGIRTGRGGLSIRARGR